MIKGKKFERLQDNEKEKNIIKIEVIIISHC